MKESNKRNIILAIECAIGRGSVAVMTNDAVVISSSDPDDAPSRAEDLLGVISRVLKRAGVDKDKLDLIAVSTGPGSYSGIRIGAATALGLKDSLGIECVGIGVLEAMAFSAPDHGGVICAVPVGKKDAAWQRFAVTEGRPQPVEPPVLSSESELALLLANDPDAALFIHSELLFRSGIHQTVGLSKIVDAGTDLAEMLGRAAAHGLGDRSLRPIYLRNRMHAPDSAGF